MSQNGFSIKPGPRLVTGDDDTVASGESHPPPIKVLRNGDATYEVDGYIGRGGMGVVFRGRQNRLERPVAIKMLPHETGDSGKINASRLKREARTTALQTLCPYLVQIIDYFDDDEGSYIVMQYLPGPNLEMELKDRVAQHKGPFGASEVSRILLGLAEALDTLHSSNIVHRDIKASNVIMVSDVYGRRRPVLIDLGIARIDSEVFARANTITTTTGATLGTPQYMSPEQAKGEPTVDARSDIYAFGVLAYYLLTGQYPILGANAAQTMHFIITQQPLPLRARRPDLSPEIEAIVMRTLDKDPAKRPQLAGEFAREFAQHVSTVSQHSEEATVDTSGATVHASSTPVPESRAVVPSGTHTPATTPTPALEARPSTERIPRPTNPRRLWIIGGLVAVGFVAVVATALFQSLAPPASAPASAVGNQTPAAVVFEPIPPSPVVSNSRPRPVAPRASPRIERPFAPVVPRLTKTIIDRASSDVTTCVLALAKNRAVVSRTDRAACQAVCDNTHLPEETRRNARQLCSR